MMAPPGVPKDRLTALRAGFDAVMKDAPYRARIKAKQLDVNPKGHVQLTKIILDTLAVSPKMLVKIKKAIGVK